MDTKFCKHCGEKIALDAVICPFCGRQVEELKSKSEGNSNIVINNSQQQQQQQQMYANNRGGKEVDKWTSFIICLFLGFLGGHKFYENNPVMGIIYLFTGGLFFIGVFIDLIVILGKPDKYYV